MFIANGNVMEIEHKERELLSGWEGVRDEDIMFNLVEKTHFISLVYLVRVMTLCVFHFAYFSSFSRIFHKLRQNFLFKHKFWRAFNIHGWMAHGYNIILKFFTHSAYQKHPQPNLKMPGSLDEADEHTAEWNLNETTSNNPPSFFSQNVFLKLYLLGS